MAPIRFNGTNDMPRSYAQQKAGLTRAIRKGTCAAVWAECERVLSDWEGTYWPDDWMRWQRALDDVFPFGYSPSLGNPLTYPEDVTA